MVLVIDVTECFVGVVFTTLVSLTTIYGYNYYISYQRQEYFKKMLFDCCTFLYKGINIGAQLEQVNVLGNILNVATAFSQNICDNNKKMDLNELLNDPVVISRINTIVDILSKDSNVNSILDNPQIMASVGVLINTLSRNLNE